MYIQVSLTVPDNATREILIALLSDAGYEGFEETAEGLQAYISEDMFRQQQVAGLANSYGVAVNTTRIKKQNWNHEWEQHFQPVVIDDFCVIRADFHPAKPGVKYDIVITPKMSFGTGHHATTQLMVEEMKTIDMAGKKVLDFGTGTGILAILAELMGAADIIAIDNDEWAFENAKDNLLRNSCKKISLSQGSLEMVEGGTYDIILANINRHILLQYMTVLYEKLEGQGTIIMSGLLAEDNELVTKTAIENGFKYIRKCARDNWISLVFGK